MSGPPQCTKCYFCFELATCGDLFDCVLAKGKPTKHIRSIINAIDYLNQHALPHFANMGTSPTVTSSLSAFPCKSITPLSQRKAPSFSWRAAHLFHRLFGYVAPKVIKNTGYRDSHRRLVDRYDRFHTHTQAKHKLITLSAQTSSPTLSTATPLFMPTVPLPSLSIISTPKSSFRVCTGLLFLIMPSPLSDVSPPSIHSILPPSRRLSPALGLPPSLWRHSQAVSFFPTLRQNWSPRTQWHSALTVIRAGNSSSYFAASASGGWYDLDPNPRVKRRWRRRSMTLVKMSSSFELTHQEPSLPWTDVVRNNLDDFLALLHVKSKKCNFRHVIFTLLKDSIQKWEQGEWDIQIGLKLRISGWEQSSPYWP